MILMSNFFINQKGIAPIILVIILSIVLVGVGGVVYNSKKEIKVRSDKTSEVSKAKTPEEPSSENSVAVAADKSGKLAEEPFIKKADSQNAAMPSYSFNPPAGWSEQSGSGNIVTQFMSPTKDKIEEGLAWLRLAPNVAVFAVEEEFNSFDEAIEAAKSDLRKSGFEFVQTQKTKINGEDAYFTEATINIGEISKDALEAQMKQEIARSGQKVSEEDLQKDIDVLLRQAKGRVIGYMFYKDGYFVTVSGKALDSFWDKRGPQIKASIDTFRFLLR